MWARGSCNAMRLVYVSVLLLIGYTNVIGAGKVDVGEQPAAPLLTAREYCRTLFSFSLWTALACACTAPTSPRTRYKMKVRIKTWNAVAAWRWDMPEDDMCGICRNPYDSTCSKCKFPGDECPLRRYIRKDACILREKMLIESSMQLWVNVITLFTWYA